MLLSPGIIESMIFANCHGPWHLIWWVCSERFSRPAKLVLPFPQETRRLSSLPISGTDFDAEFWIFDAEYLSVYITECVSRTDSRTIMLRCLVSNLAAVTFTPVSAVLDTRLSSRSGGLHNRGI